MENMWYVGVFAVLAMSVMSVPVQAEVAGEVVSVQGKVFVRADGKASAGELKPARPGDPVRAGDVVNTSSDGKVKILLKDRSIVDLGPSGLFKVDHFAKNSGNDRQADLSMMYGTLRAAISQKIEGKGRFRVRTPAATMGVRGTEFVIKSDVQDMAQVRQVVTNPGKPLAPPAAAAGAQAAKTEVTVIQGAVEVKKEVAKPALEPGKRAPASVKEEKPVQLTAGTQLVTKQGEAAPMKAVTVDAKQLATLTKEVRVVDNTFQKAVVIDAIAPGKDGSGGLALSGEATRAALSGIVSVPQLAPITMSDIGFAGTFGAASGFMNRPAVVTPGPRTIRVIVVRKP